MAANFANSTIWTGDNLDIMRGMNSACVDLIYLDPPFNSSANYAAPIGSKAAGVAFKDTWSLDDINLAWHGEIKHANPALYALLDASRQIHGDATMSYLIYMAIRIMEMHRILKETGSIYLHCDPTASHYLKLVLDSVFGGQNFRNEIVWYYYNKYGAGRRVFARNYDQVFFYSKTARYHFFPQRERRDVPVRQLVRENVNGVLKNKRDAEGRVLYRVSHDKKIDAVWRIPCMQPASKSYLGYPTQKPVPLLERIIRASSREEDLVLDPFCGCATACIAAQQENRQWVGIDISPQAANLVKLRMQNELGLFFEGAHRTDIPHRSDLGRVIRYNDTRNKKHLYGEQGGYCNGCETHFEIRHFQVDHIIPRAKGGTDHISNLQLRCGHCNAIKGDRPQEYLLACLIDKGWIHRRQKYSAARQLTQ